MLCPIASNARQRSYFIQFFIWCCWCSVCPEWGHGWGFGVHGVIINATDCVQYMPLKRRKNPHGKKSPLVLLPLCKQYTAVHTSPAITMRFKLQFHMGAIRLATWPLTIFICSWATASRQKIENWYRCCAKVQRLQSGPHWFLKYNVHSSFHSCLSQASCI